MKTNFIVLSLLLLTLNLFGQDYSKLSEIKMTNVSDYKENETKVLECSN